METLQNVGRTDSGRSIVNVNEEEVRNHLAELVRGPRLPCVSGPRPHKSS